MTAAEADALTEQTRTERRLVIDNNKAWVSAEKVRRTWLQSYLTRKTPQKGIATYIAAELAHGDHALRRAMESLSMLPELLGCKGRTDLAATADAASEGRGQVIALGDHPRRDGGQCDPGSLANPSAGHQAVLPLPSHHRLRAVRRGATRPQRVPHNRRPADSPAAVTTATDAAPPEDQPAGIPAGNQAVA
jgi:hypothetical protein